MENNAAARAAGSALFYGVLVLCLTVLGDLSPIIRFGALAALVLTFVVRWASPRLAKMRELDEQTPHIPDQRASFFARFLTAHQALAEEEQRFLAVEAYAPGLSDYAERVVFPQGPRPQTETDVEQGAVFQCERKGEVYQIPPELLTEIPRLEKAALESGHVEWDYPMRSEAGATARRVLGYVAFIVLWIGLLFVFVFGTRGHGGIGESLSAWHPYAYVLAVSAFTTIPSALLAWTVGAWRGINPYDHGYALYSRGKLKRAAKRLERAVAQHPESLRGGYALASLLTDTGRLDEAAERASQLLLTYPALALAHELKARIESNRGNHSTAADEYRRAAEAADAAWALTFGGMMRRMAQLSRDQLL